MEWARWNLSTHQKKKEREEEEKKEKEAKRRSRKQHRVAQQSWNQRNRGEEKGENPVMRGRVGDHSPKRSGGKEKAWPPGMHLSGGPANFRCKMEYGFASANKKWRSTLIQHKELSTRT